MRVVSGSESSAESAPICVLVADDLTGACDSAVEFAQRGLITRVGIGRSPTIPSAVMAVSTDSRRLTAQAAAEITRSVARSLALASARIIFKKIDSTLRGAVIAECDALLEAAGAPFGVIAPALPSQGRMLKNGILEVRDVAMVRTMNAAEVLGEMGATVAPLSPHRAGSAEELADRMQVLGETHRYVLCDAASDHDLMMTARSILACSNRPLWIGSAGLARQAAALLCPACQTRGTVLLHNHAPVLLCVGSNHPVTEIQLRALCQHDDPVVLEAASTTVTEFQQILSAARHVVLRIETAAADPGRVRELLQAIGPPAPAAIVMTGGDTASLICRAGEVEQLLLEGELVPGVATGLMEGGALDGLRFATKSGGFGTETCLADAVRLLSGARIGETQ